jgi:hypothetical protein
MCHHHHNAHHYHPVGGDDDKDDVDGWMDGWMWMVMIVRVRSDYYYCNYDEDNS